jgi:hypothetical protein
MFEEMVPSVYYAKRKLFSLMIRNEIVPSSSLKKEQFFWKGHAQDLGKNCVSMIVQNIKIGWVWG